MSAVKSAVKIVSRSIGDRSKPCVIMISGKSCTMNMWRGFSEKIASSGYHVITFDSRDMGLSQKFLGLDPTSELEKHRRGLLYEYPYTLDDLADDVEQLLDQYEVPKAHVLGASMGGSIAQIFATRYATRTLSLITIMSSLNINKWATEGYKANSEFFKRVMFAPSATSDMTLEEVLNNRIPVWSEFIKDEAHPNVSPEEIALLSAEITEDFQRGGIDFRDVGGLRQMLATNAWIDSRLEAHRVALSNLPVPTLILHGKYDKLFPVGAARELASIIPNSTIELYEGGHNLPLDQQDQLINAIVRHLTCI